MTTTGPQQNVLITGGCGFMGSHFVRHLYNTRPDYRIINLDLLTYAGNAENLSDIEAREAGKDDAQRRYIHIKGDICDAVLVDRLFREYPFSLVVHFAAETHVDRSLFNFSDFVRTNVEGTRVILEATRVHTVPRMVHISTDEVYGNVPEGYSTEESPLNPSNPYAASKAAADMLARTYANVYRVPLAIVRSGNNYGPFQYPEKLIPLSITNMIAGEKMPMHGNGEHVRSWVHVEDFCDAVDRIAHHTQPFGVFNIAGEHYSNLQIVAAVAEYLKRNPAEHMVMVPDRPSADRRYAPNSFRLERELGWKRTRFLKEALPEIIEWYRTNEAWWQAIKARKEFLDHYEKQSKALWY